MDWQLAAVGLGVAAAAAFLARRAWRTWAHKGSGCGGGCGSGCHDKSAAAVPPARLISVDQLTVRRRGRE